MLQKACDISITLWWQTWDSFRGSRVMFTLSGYWEVPLTFLESQIYRTNSSGSLFFNLKNTQIPSIKMDTFCVQFFLRSAHNNIYFLTLCPNSYLCFAHKFSMYLSSLSFIRSHETLTYPYISNRESDKEKK